MKKSITLITGSNHTKAVLLEQLMDYLPTDIEIKGYAFDEGIEGVIRDDLVILSSETVKEDLINANIFDYNCDLVIAKRTINFDYIDKIVYLPVGTNVLFVNDSAEPTYDSIEVLKRIGFDYLNYIPFYPGLKGSFEDIKIAITPGEVDKVPNHIEKVIDIKARIFDFETIIEILKKLDLLDKRTNLYSQKYLKKIIDTAKRLSQSNIAVNELNKHLSLVIDGLNDGILLYDANGRISVFNENLRKMLNIHQQNIVGKSINSIIYNKSLVEFLGNENVNYEDKFFTINNTKIVVNRFYVSKDNSIVAVFKNVQETIEINDRLKREFIKKGLYAKHCFTDIIGNSEKIANAKTIAKKLSKSNLTILIEGESGTGKELFASSIHNESGRKNGPFLAVNFSALPDELIESELFGYEEGAFTGAKKGGKAGLFELADGGTIFLDEIGDTTLKLQARLLRVLQEKEVMRIGGTEIKPVDVRVIAATNKNLSKMVQERSFREDLFYRLKMGYINIPTLKERKDDLKVLMEYFVRQETNEDITFSPEVFSVLYEYQWYGNIRELKNTIMYIMAVKEENYITLKDIPNKGFFEQNIKEIVHEGEKQNFELDDELRTILEIIHNLRESGKIAGREIIEKETMGTTYEFTKYQVRNRLDKLEGMGLIIKKRGRHGTILTEKGERYLQLAGR